MSSDFQLDTSVELEGMTPLPRRGSPRHVCLSPEDSVFPSPVLSDQRICGRLAISLAREGQDRVPWGRAHSLGTSDSPLSHTEELISKQTACRCTVGQCFFWLPWSERNGQALVRLASEGAQGSWEIRVRL